MKQILAVLFLLICVSGNTQTQERVFVSDGFMKGKDYLDMPTASKRAYAMGAINGMLASPMLGAPEGKVQWLVNCTNNMSDEQVAAIITKYINDRPGEWHYGLNLLTFNAMIKSCPNSH